MKYADVIRNVYEMLDPDFVSDLDLARAKPVAMRHHPDCPDNIIWQGVIDGVSTSDMGYSAEEMQKRREMADAYKKHNDWYLIGDGNGPVTAEELLNLVEHGDVRGKQ